MSLSPRNYCVLFLLFVFSAACSQMQSAQNAGESSNSGDPSLGGGNPSPDGAAEGFQSGTVENLEEDNANFDDSEADERIVAAQTKILKHELADVMPVLPINRDSIDQIEKMQLAEKLIEPESDRMSQQNLGKELVRGQNLNKVDLSYSAFSDESDFYGSVFGEETNFVGADFSKVSSMQIPDIASAIIAVGAKFDDQTNFGQACTESGLVPETISALKALQARKQVDVRLFNSSLRERSRIIDEDCSTGSIDQCRVLIAKVDENITAHKIRYQSSVGKFRKVRDVDYRLALDRREKYLALRSLEEKMEQDRVLEEERQRLLAAEEAAKAKAIADAEAWEETQQKDALAKAEAAKELALAEKLKWFKERVARKLAEKGQKHDESRGRADRAPAASESNEDHDKSDAKEDHNVDHKDQP